MVVSWSDSGRKYHRSLQKLPQFQDKIMPMYDHLVVEDNISSTRRQINTIPDITEAKGKKDQKEQGYKLRNE